MPPFFVIFLQILVCQWTSWAAQSLTDFLLGYLSLRGCPVLTFPPRGFLVNLSWVPWHLGFFRWRTFRSATVLDLGYLDQLAFSAKAYWSWFSLYLDPCCRFPRQQRGPLWFWTLFFAMQCQRHAAGLLLKGLCCFLLSPLRWLWRFVWPLPHTLARCGSSSG